jgi:hypothetical protein
VSARVADRAAAAWERFWHAPEPPLNLAVARVVLALQALWILLSRDLPALSALPASFWAAVPLGARWRYLLWEGHPRLEQVLQAAALLALAGVVLNVGTRACCFVAGLLLYHLAPLETLFFTVSPWARGLTIPVLGLLVFSAVPRAPRADQGWALRLVQLFVCQIYFFSGWAKLRAAGPSWASAENIRAWLLLSNQDDQLAVFTAPGLWVADHPLLCGLMGAAALAVDLGFMAALFWRRGRPLLVALVAAFHLGILFTQNYAFLSAPLLLVFIDWSRGSEAEPGVTADPSRLA